MAGNEFPLGLGGQAITGRDGFRQFEPPVLCDVGRRQPVLGRQPVAERRGVLPADPNRGLAVQVQGFFLEDPRGVSLAELPELLVGDLTRAEVERPFQLDGPLRFIRATAGLAPRAAHDKAPAAYQLQLLAEAGHDRRGYLRGARLLDGRQLELDDLRQPGLGSDGRGVGSKPRLADLDLVRRGGQREGLVGRPARGTIDKQLGIRRLAAQRDLAQDRFQPERQVGTLARGHRLRPGNGRIACAIDDDFVWHAGREGQRHRRAAPVAPRDADVGARRLGANRQRPVRQPELDRPDLERLARLDGDWRLEAAIPGMLERKRVAAGVEGRLERRGTHFLAVDQHARAGGHRPDADAGKGRLQRYRKRL